MRGDRPRRRVARRSELPAAPHARGSTRHGDYHARGSPGCPACAGIDPMTTRSARRRKRLPRMRGDRPCEAVRIMCSLRAAPHARGSTRAGAGVDPGHDGCPACAGIDPYLTADATDAARLPRMRGDRPADNRISEGVRRAAPHARGSTRHDGNRRRVGEGCPACAGIDPTRWTRCATSSRLPRMRGDRPCVPTVRVQPAQAAPHARGSTRVWSDRQGVRRGCPACAGIDPTPCRSHRWSVGLPRMRGDRPAFAARWIASR